MTVDAASETRSPQPAEPRPERSVAEARGGIEPPGWLRAVAVAIIGAARLVRALCSEG